MAVDSLVRDYVFKFADLLRKKFNLEYTIITIRIGGRGVGVTDLDINQHYKKKDSNDIDLQDLCN